MTAGKLIKILQELDENINIQNHTVIMYDGEVVLTYSDISRIVIMENGKLR